MFLVLALLIVATAGSVFCYAITNFGQGLLFHSFSYLIQVVGLPFSAIQSDVGIRITIFRLAAIGPFMTSIQFVRHWKRVPWKFVALVAPVKCAVEFPCTFFLTSMPPSAARSLQLVFGLILLGVSMTLVRQSALETSVTENKGRRYSSDHSGVQTKGLPEYADSDEESVVLETDPHTARCRKHTETIKGQDSCGDQADDWLNSPLSRDVWPGALGMAISAGLMNGMFSVGGPAIMVFVLIYKPPSESWTAASSAIFVIDGFARLGFLLEMHALGGWELWPEYTAIAIGVCLGMFAGVSLQPFIPELAVRRLVLLLLCAATVGMCSSGLPSMPQRWIIQMYVVFAAFVLLSLSALLPQIEALNFLQASKIKQDQLPLPKVVPCIVGAPREDIELRSV